MTSMASSANAHGGHNFKLLIVVANPIGTPTLNLAQEVETIEEVLESEPGIIIKLSYSYDLVQVFQEFKPNIQYFCGHGTEEGNPIFQTELGEQRIIETDQLCSLLAKDHQNS